MSTENNHINYSAADIERYWTGKMSASEQHAIEKAALDDPFLADAMDGYEEKTKAPAPSITGELDELKDRLAKRVAEKQSSRVVPMLWWRIAAIVVVFIGMAWLYTSINIKSKVENIAKNDELKKEPAPAIVNDTDKEAAGNKGTTDTIRDELAINKTTKPAIVKQTPTVDKLVSTATENAVATTPGQPAPVTQPETEKSEEADAKKDVAISAPIASKKESAPAIVEMKQEQKARSIAADDSRANNNYAITERAKNNASTFNGKITDLSNKPVANAAVQIPNLNVATQTDKRGDFSFMAQDTGLSVSIAADGFETQNVHLRNNATPNQIVLTPVQNTLREVTDQNNNAEKRKQGVIAPAKDISIKILNAEPFIGWTAYNEYLDKNKKLKEDAKNIHGTVIVSFQVHSKMLNNFRIEQSLDDELDAEAIRLIKEGPAWKLIKGKKASTTVAVKF